MVNGARDHILRSCFLFLLNVTVRDNFMYLVINCIIQDNAYHVLFSCNSSTERHQEMRLT